MTREVTTAQTDTIKMFHRMGYKLEWHLGDKNRVHVTLDAKLAPRGRKISIGIDPSGIYWDPRAREAHWREGKRQQAVRMRAQRHPE